MPRAVNTILCCTLAAGNGNKKGHSIPTVALLRAFLQN